MERVLASLRELISALDLQERAGEIEAVARELLAAHDNAVAEEATTGQRPENKALAICYIAANYVLLPDRVSYEAMMRAAAATVSWRSEPVPGKNGMTKLVKRFARRICPIEHDPEIVEKTNLSFTVCTQCRYILHTGGSVKHMSDEGSFGVDPQVPRRAGLQGYGGGTKLAFDDAPEEKAMVKSSTAVITQMLEPEITPALGTDAEVMQNNHSDGSTGADGENVDGSKDDGVQGTPLLEITQDVRKKWLASAMIQAKKLSNQLPAINPAVPGAIALVKRSIDSYITSEKVLGSLVQKVVRMAILHESKMQNLSVTTKDLNVQPSDYLKFIAAASTTVAQTTTTSDSSLVERALKIIAAYERKAVGNDTRERITRFQAVTRRKLMGFSPAMAAAVIAYIDIVRHDPTVVLSKIASISGSNTSSLYNATGRFLEKIGRSGDPAASLNERVVAAFPPRDK